MLSKRSAAVSDKTKVRIFESYGWADASDIAQRLKALLDETGRYEVWIDSEHLRADDKHFPPVLQQAVADSEVVLALLSPESVRGLTGGDRLSTCYNELRYAEELNRPIIPVRVIKFEGPTPFLIIKYRRLNWLDRDQPKSRGLQEIINAIEFVRDRGNLLDPRIAPLGVSFRVELDSADDNFTGRQWLFTKVENWLDGPNPCLVIEGNAGSGKTALVAMLARHNAVGGIVAYHFCSQLQVQSTIDPVAFVRSIAAMLATAIDAYADQLATGQLAEWLEASDADTMLCQGVLAPLRNVSMPGTYYIAVDALDEADVVNDSVSVPQLLADALEDFPPWLKLLVTTRPYQHVQGLFSQAETCVLDQDNNEHLSDLSAYIARRLDALASTGVLSPADRERACSQVTSNADGNFQYAARVLDALKEGEFGAHSVDQLPKSLYGMYYRQGSRRFAKLRERGLWKQVLSVLLAAKEPLSESTLKKILKGLDDDTLRAVRCFVVSAAEGDGWRIAHKSICDWLVSEKAGHLKIDRAAGEQLLLAYCADWPTNGEPYALKHVIAHLLEAGKVADAMAAVQQGLFEKRLEKLGEPRLDGEDARRLTARLIEDNNIEAILTLAKTANVWQRDGVAAVLQSPSTSNQLADQVVGELLAASA